MERKKSQKTDLFGKIGDLVLGGRKSSNKSKRGAEKEKSPKWSGQEIPKKLRGFFENRHAGWPEYVMLKAQLGIIAIFVTEVIYLVFLPTKSYIFIALLMVLSAYLLYLTATQVKKAFERDYPAYRGFIVMCVAIAWFFVLALKFFPVFFSIKTLQLAIVPPLIAIGFVTVAFCAFRAKYGRNFTYGRVEEAHESRAIVRVGYDIRSNVKAGLYSVENFLKVKKGDFVKLSVERPMLGLRGAKVKAILGKTK